MKQDPYIKELWSLIDALANQLVRVTSNSQPDLAVTKVINRYQETNRIEL